ncbi:MAG: pyroglutamyl-peptidase I [Peptostreptococcaceae bacterium]|nr:pyroglutamyl-peptidase I [Peptostreptococcaceae bacterium]
MKVLVTGFDPFGGESVNPALEAVMRLPDTIAGSNIIKEEVPTVFQKSGEVLERLIARHEPDVVICVGQAGGRSSVSVEKVAINFAEARIADNEGNQPRDLKIKEDGETAYFSTLPIKAMVMNMRKHEIPANISYTAGTFVCNDIMYTLLYLLNRKYPQMRGGFIHVPFIPAQVVGKAEGTPSMSLEMIRDALICAIEATVQNERDIQDAMGTIM